MAKKTKTTDITTTALPSELMKIAESSGMQLTEAQSIGSVFAPYMAKVNEISALINNIPNEDPNTEDAAMARKLRLELVSNRGKNGILQAHTDLKAGILVRGRLIDSYKNVVEDSSKIAELHAESIEKHSERKEAVRLDAVEASRIEALTPYGTNTEFVNIRSMDDDTFTRFLANEKLLFNAHQEELRKAEEVRIEAEKVAEAERVEAERIRVEEQKKRDAELAELKRKEKEREAAEIKRISDELARVEKFASLLVKSGFELTNNDSYIPNDQRRWCKGDYTISFGQLTLIKTVQEINSIITDTNARIKQDEAKEAEIKRLRAEQVKRDSEALELRKKQEAAALKIKQDAEAKQELERQAALAPDKEKLKAWFEELKVLQSKVPVFKSKEGSVVSNAIIKGFTQLRSDIVVAAKVLK